MLYKKILTILLLNNLLLINCKNKTVEDPVARHDLLQCSTYLCPKYRYLAKEYLENGCIGNFYIPENYLENSNLNLMENENIEEKENVKSVSMNSLLFLTIISGLVSLVAGYKMGKYERMKEIKLNIKELDENFR